jgi:hypothetical protein
MPMKDKRIYEAQSPATPVTRLSLRPREGSERAGSGTRPQDEHHYHPGNGFSREVILRLIDWIKAL